MNNPWHNIEIGENAPAVINCIIEIENKSKGKFELDKKTGMIKLDRVLFSSMHYPANYGFIPQTYCDDKDPLDALVISQVNLPPMCMVEARVIGAMQMIDGGEMDDKIIAVADKDPQMKEIHDLKDLPSHLIDEIKDFFQRYKILEKKEVEIKDFLDKKAAIKIVEDSIQLYKESFGQTNS